MQRSFVVALASVLALALSACGEDTLASSTDAPAGGSEPVTARALAWLAAEYAGDPDSATSASDLAEEFVPEGVGTELRYGSDGEYDGDVLAVGVGKGFDEQMVDCAAQNARPRAGCVTTDRGILGWGEEAPGEDPGGVYVVVDKGDSTVVVSYAGPVITGDPRKLDLPISTDMLLAIANDPRVDVTTSAEAVEAGADLSYWRPAAH